MLDQARARVRELEDLNAQLQTKEYQFRQAIDGDDLEWTKCLARYPRWPEELLLRLYYENKHWELSGILAGNPSLPAENINELVNECLSDEVFVAALENPSCDAETIAQIIWLTNLSEPHAAAKHPNYSEEVLLDLLNEKAADENPSVRSWVAEYAICPPETLRRLAGDKIADVRKSVASNIKCPLDCLYQLESDSDESVRKAASENPAHPNNIEKTDVNHLCKILSDADSPDAALKEFVCNPNHSLRQAIALNPACPEELLAVLANDPEIRVRIAAKHRIKK